ncbi:MAG: patatin-like phospholipase family protein [Nitrospirota bacterium]
MRTQNRPKLGLALSGGAARSIAHIGVLKAFEDAGVRIDAIAGTSGGAMIGALYLDGMGIPELLEITKTLGWGSILKPSLSAAGLIDSRVIHDFMKKYLKASRIEELTRPFAAVCTDLGTGDKVVLTKGPLAAAVQASCSLPIFFTPTEFNGMTLIDGGYSSQIPVLAAKDELRAETVVAADVNYKALKAPKKWNMFGISMHLTLLIARRNADRELTFADSVIEVCTEGIGLHEIKKHAELFKRGYRAAAEKMDEIKRLIA